MLRRLVLRKCSDWFPQGSAQRWFHGSVNLAISMNLRMNPGSGGVRCSSVVRAFARGAMGRRIDPSWSGPIELFLVPASAP